MQIYYCNKCRSRVSSVDVANGKGHSVGDKIYCLPCARELGLENTKKERGTKSSKPSPRVGSGAQPPVAPQASPVMAVRTPHAPAIPRRSSKAPIIIMSVICLALLLTVLILMLKHSREKAAEASRSREQLEYNTQALPEDIIPAVPEEPAPSDTNRPADIPTETAPPAEAAVPADDAPRPRLPAPPPAVTGSGWQILSGPGWQDRLIPRRGSWILNDGMLVNSLDPDAGMATIETYSRYEQYDAVITFLVDQPCTVEVRFNILGKASGRCVIRKPAPDEWHTFVYTVSGRQVTAATLDGIDVQNGTGQVQLAWTDMAPAGTISASINPLLFEKGRFIIAEWAVRPEGEVTLINLLPQGDMEIIESGRTRGWESGDPWSTVVVPDTQVSHSGNASLRIENPGTPDQPNARFIITNFPVEPSRDYRLIYWMKTEDFESNCGNLGMKVLTLNTKGCLAQENRHDATQDWRQYETVFNTGELSRIHFYFGAWGGLQGRAWFDDIQLYEAGPPAMALGDTGDWINLLQGADLAAAGWNHFADHEKFSFAWTLADGVLTKPVSEYQSRIDRTIGFREGEIICTFEADSDFWMFGFGAKGNSFNLDCNRNSEGRHVLRILVADGQVEVTVDGQWPFSGMKITRSLQGPLTADPVLSIAGHPAGSLKVTELKYRSAAR